MAGVTAAALRDLARETVRRAGGCGFMRFAPEGGALLATDAPRRCADGAQALIRALEEAGFSCACSGGLLLLSPADALLNAMDAPPGEAPIDWDSPLHPAQALAARWLAAPRAPLTDAGRRLAVETLRLTGQPGRDVLSGLGALRARAAVMLRSHDCSGMRAAGAVLRAWCDAQKEEMQ